MMEALRQLIFGSATFLVAALPSSTTYQLNSYGFGSGGSSQSTSTNYSINGTTGEVAGSAASSNYKAGSGENFLKQANVPLVMIDNVSSFYNKLDVTVVPENNPSDAKFAIAISTNGFATTRYIKSDFTIGTTLTAADFLTYAAWGGAAGKTVRGLQFSTVYSVKGRAQRGDFTETGWGPVATAATVAPTLAFDIDVAATDISTNPPYAINFGSLPVNTVTDSPLKIWVSLDTNGESGGKVFLSGQNSGLLSGAANYTISSATGDLASLLEGFGAQGASATQDSGGPLSLVAPYDGTGSNVGVQDALIREIFSTDEPITSGRGSLLLKAKTKSLTPASGDYTETLTMVASASF